METYDSVSYELSKKITTSYSTSFSLSTRLFPPTTRLHIYAIYGLVRIADEIVDTYKGSDADMILESFRVDTYEGIKRGYSTNPIIHSFARTAKQYGIDKELIEPFFLSMAMDLRPLIYTNDLYRTYIHGSAEVIGLMCLKVFCEGDDKKYRKLSSGAQALGSAYQKVNFLRDIATDSKQLGRLYFPSYTFDSFDEQAKASVIRDIEHDFKDAARGIVLLPKQFRLPIQMSYTYYHKLLDTIKETPLDVLKEKRIRVGTVKKAVLMASTVVRAKLS